jgi:hypothetical protein
VLPDLLRDCFPCSNFGSFLLLLDFFLWRFLTAFVPPYLLRDCFPCSYFGSFLLLSDFFPLALSHCLLCFPICFGTAFPAVSSVVSSCFQTFSLWRFLTAFVLPDLLRDCFPCSFFGSFLLLSDFFPLALAHCLLCFPICFETAFPAVSSVVSSCFQTFSLWRLLTAFCASRFAS